MIDVTLCDTSTKLGTLVDKTPMKLFGEGYPNFHDVMTSLRHDVIDRGVEKAFSHNLGTNGRILTNFFFFCTFFDMGNRFRILPNL